MQRSPQGGLPVRAALHADGLYVALRNIGWENLQDAFMQETIARIPASETVLHVTRDELRRAACDTAPAGIIFHVARCGSTLISQSLKQLDDLAVYAEPQPVNEILVPPHGWPRADVVAAIRTLGNVFARHAGRPYVLKLSSWNTLLCDIVTEAFPETNWVLSLRDPVEVGVSLMQQPPVWLSGAGESSRGLAEMIAPDGVSGSREELLARAYGAFCAAVARLDAGRGRLVAYEALPAAVWETVAPHFSLPVDARQRAAIAQAARMNTKAPLGSSREFAPDTATKQATASPELRRAIDAFARPHLERLVRHHAG
jgi:hypothetical protein